MKRLAVPDKPKRLGPAFDRALAAAIETYDPELAVEVAGWPTPTGRLVDFVLKDHQGRPVGNLRIEARPKARSVHFFDLSLAPGLQDRDFYGHLLETWPEPLVAYGVPEVTATALQPDSRAVLERGGLTMRDGMLRCDLTAPSSRILAYREWKRGNADRPAWHRKLGG